MRSKTQGLNGGKGSQDNRNGQSRKPLEVRRGDLHPRESHMARGCGDKLRTTALRKPSKGATINFTEKKCDMRVITN